MGTRGFDRATRALRIFPRAIDRRMTQQLRRSGAQWHREMVTTRFTAALAIYPERSTAHNLHNRSNQLRLSLGVRIIRGKKGPLLEAYSQNSPYARLQELGGDITPRKRRWLTIPAEANVTHAGVTRKSARQIVNEGGFFIRGRSGLLLVKREPGGTIHSIGGREDSLTIYFFLRKRVHVPPRLGMRDTWHRLEEQRTKNLKLAVLQALHDIGAR